MGAIPLEYQRAACIALIGFTVLGVLAFAQRFIASPEDHVIGAAEPTESRAAQPDRVFLRPEQLSLERPAIAVHGPDPFIRGTAPVGAQVDVAPVAPPPPTPTSEVVAPSAPAMPYRFFGQVQDAKGATQLFLVRENLLFPIKVGDVLDGQYRVAAISESTIDLVYLPLNQTQQIGR
jgi:hypothetical protein